MLFVLFHKKSLTNFSVNFRFVFELSSNYFLVLNIFCVLVVSWISRVFFEILSQNLFYLLWKKRQKVFFCVYFDRDFVEKGGFGSSVKRLVIHVENWKPANNKKKLTSLRLRVSFVLFSTIVVLVKLEPSEWSFRSMENARLSLHSGGYFWK